MHAHACRRAHAHTYARARTRARTRTHARMACTRTCARAGAHTQVSVFLIDDIVLQLPLLRGLSSHALTILLPIIIPLEFSEGTLLCRVGDETHDAYISRTGLLTLLTVEGKTLRRLKPGEMFGELSLLDVQVHNRTANQQPWREGLSNQSRVLQSPCMRSHAPSACLSSSRNDKNFVFNRRERTLMPPTLKTLCVYAKCRWHGR